MRSIEIKKLLDFKLKDNDINLVTKILDYLTICTNCDYIYNDFPIEIFKNTCKECIVQIKPCYFSMVGGLRFPFELFEL